MKRLICWLLFITVAVIFFISSSALIYICYTYRTAAAEYEQLSDSAVRILPVVPDDGHSAVADDIEAEESRNGYLDQKLQIDFGILKQINPDILAWLDIPGTSVSYPVVRGVDNTYYLDRGIRGQESSSGAIFMDVRNQPDLSDDNIIIYGHNMKNGSMFGQLRKFREKVFYENHPYIDLYLPDGVFRYAIYACYEESAEIGKFAVAFEDSAAQAEWMDEGVRKSACDTGIRPAAGQQTVMLATCTGTGYSHRLVVLAVRLGE